MAGGGGLGMRTIWINLRAMNYTDQAFRASIQNINKLTDAEKEEYRQLLRRKDEARLNIQVGMLYAAQTVMITQKLWGLLSLTQAGAGYMSEFNNSLNDMKVALADTLFTALKPVLDVMKSFFEMVRDNSALRTVIVAIAGLAVVLMTLYASYKVVHGMQQLSKASHELQAWLITKEAVLKAGLTKTNTVLGLSYKSLAMSIGLVTAGFSVFMMLGQVIGNNSGAIVAGIFAITLAVLALATALNVLSVGTLTAGQLGALAAGTGLAAGVMGLQSMGGFAHGTRALPDTGMFYGHKGEIVYNPQTNRPAGVEDQVMGINRATVGGNNVSVTFTGDLYTNADIDNIDNEIGKKIYRAVKGAS